MNRQPWTFVVVSSPDAVEQLAETVYAPANVRGAALVVAIVGKRSFDTGRAAQNMMLAAWNDGLLSCPGGIQDAEAAAAVVGGEVAIVLTFGYPARLRRPERRSADEWSRRANRKPLGELVRRV